MHNSKQWFLLMVIGMYMNIPIIMHAGNFDTIKAPSAPGRQNVPFVNASTIDEDDTSDQGDYDADARPDQSNDDDTEMQTQDVKSQQAAPEQNEPIEEDTDSKENEETSTESAGAKEPTDEQAAPEEEKKSDAQQEGDIEMPEETEEKQEQSEEGVPEKENEGEESDKEEPQQTSDTAEQPSEKEEKPERVKPAPEKVEPEAEMVGPEDVKIDTIDLTEPKGNWLLKRWWWEQAEILYEKIKQREEEVFEERMEFLRKRIDMDRAVFNPFYKNVGIGQGELSETITMLISQIENERKKSGALAEQERAFLDVLQTEKKTLAQLQENVNVVSDADLAIDDALLKLMEQINRVRGYERQAWDQFKAIARELSDQRAYELYEEMKGLSRNVTDILIYIRQPFAHYFQNLSTKATEQVEKIKTDIQTLKEKGIDLKQESARLDTQDNLKEEQAHEQACAAQVKKAIAQTQAQKRGWFGMIADFFAGIGRAIMTPFRYVAQWFTGAPSSVAPKKSTVVPTTLSKPQAGVGIVPQKTTPQKEPSEIELPAFPEPPAQEQEVQK